MVIGEFVDRIKSLYSKGVESDDSRLTSRHIYDVLKSSRSKLISQKSNKKQLVSDWTYQTIPCIELIEAQQHECPCIPPIGCTVYRSKYKIPTVITSLGKHLIQSVTSLEGDIIYDHISWKEKTYKKFNKYSSNNPDYYLRNDYLYITHKTNISKIVTLTACFEDPIDSLEFPSFCLENGDCENCCKSYLELEFPIDPELIDTLIQICIKELIVIFSQNIEDVSNNSKDNILEQSK